MQNQTEKLTVADQIRRDAALRDASGDALPIETRRPLVFNEDALMVHPDQVFFNPRNSRRTFDEKKIDELAASLKLEGVGLLQPILVRRRKLAPDGMAQYEAIAGDRRLMASKRAALAQIPILVRNMDERTARRVNLIENLQREDLADAEMGAALADLKEDMQSELEDWLAKAGMAPDSIKVESKRWKQARGRSDAAPWMVRAGDVAAKTGRPAKVSWDDVGGEVALGKRAIHHYLSINGLPDDVQQIATAGEFSQQQTRALTLLETPKQQRQLASEIQSRSLTGEQAAKRAREIKSGAPAGSSNGIAVRRASGKETLTANSRPSALVGAIKELADRAAIVRGPLVEHAEKFPFDAGSRIEVRASVKEIQLHLDAILTAVRVPSIEVEEIA